MAVLLVFLGGGVGAALRYGVSLVVTGPWSTWIVNAIGSFVLAWLAARVGIDPKLKLLLGTGVCGGFTTYSTFNQDTLTLLQSGQVGWAVANGLGTLGVCVILGLAGAWLGAR